jgi:hypothetical protein
VLVHPCQLEGQQRPRRVRGREIGLHPRDLLHPHLRIHQIADLRQRRAPLLGRGGLLGLLQRHLHRLVVEASSLGGPAERFLELRLLTCRDAVPERKERLVRVAIALQLQCRKPELQTRVLRVREERVLEEKLVELLAGVRVIAQLEGEHAGPVEGLLAGGGGGIGLAEVQVGFHLLRLGLATRLRLHLRERLIRVGVLPDLRARLARRCSREVRHRRLAGAGNGDQGGQRGSRDTGVLHGGRSLPDCAGRATPCQLQARRWGDSVTSRTPP